MRSLNKHFCPASSKLIYNYPLYISFCTKIKYSFRDPNLWMVKCRIGEEKATALLLMRKFLTYLNTDDPLQIKSIIAPEGVKGYIYLEAYKQTHVKTAIDNVGNLRMGKWKQEMVPIKEMTDVLKVVKEQVGLKVKQWVRLKRGLYKDDIAQVDYVDLAQNQVHLKLLPRIDYTRLRGALRTTATVNVVTEFILLLFINYLFSTGK